MLTFSALSWFFLGCFNLMIATICVLEKNVVMAFLLGSNTVLTFGLFFFKAFGGGE